MQKKRIRRFWNGFEIEWPRGCGRTAKNFEESEVTINQYKSDWESLLYQLKKKLAAVVNGPVISSEDLKNLLITSDGGANLGGQAESGQTNGANTRSSGVNEPVTNDPNADNMHIQKCDWLRNMAK